MVHIISHLLTFSDLKLNGALLLDLSGLNLFRNPLVLLILHLLQAFNLLIDQTLTSCLLLLEAFFFALFSHVDHLFLALSVLLNFLLFIQLLYPLLTPDILQVFIGFTSLLLNLK